MDNTVVFSITIVLCAMFAYIIGKLDGKYETRQKVQELKKTLALAKSAQQKMGYCLKRAQKELNDIKDSIIDARETMAGGGSDATGSSM